MLEDYLPKESKDFPGYIEKLFSSQREVRQLERFVQKEFEEECGMHLPHFSIKPIYELELLILDKNAKIIPLEISKNQPITEKDLRRLYLSGEFFKNDGDIVNLTSYSYQYGAKIFLNYYSITQRWSLSGNADALKSGFMFLLFHEASHLFFHLKKVNQLYERKPWIEETICDFIADHFSAKYNCMYKENKKEKQYQRLTKRHLKNARELFKEKNIESAKTELELLSRKVKKIYTFPYLSFFGADYYETLPSLIQEDFRSGEKVDRLTDFLGAAKNEIGLQETLRRLAKTASLKEIYKIGG